MPEYHLFRVDIFGLKQGRGLTAYQKKNFHVCLLGFKASNISKAVRKRWLAGDSSSFGSHEKEISPTRIAAQICLCFALASVCSSECAD